MGIKDVFLQRRKEKKKEERDSLNNVHHSDLPNFIMYCQLKKTKTSKQVP